MHAQHNGSAWTTAARLCVKSTTHAHVVCTAELKRERTARQDDDFVAQAKRLELQKALEDQQAAANEALLRVQEQHEAAKRTLQVCGDALEVGAWLTERLQNVRSCRHVVAPCSIGLRCALILGTTS